MLCTRCNSIITDGSFFCNFCGKKLSSNPVPKKRKNTRRQNNTGCIAKLSGKRAKPYSLRINGKFHGTFATLQQAEAVLQDITPTNIDILTVTFAQYYKIFKKNYFTNDLGTKSKKGLENSYKKLYLLHSLKMREITASDIRLAINSDYKTNANGDNLGELSYSSKRKHMYLLNQMFQSAIGDKILTTSPCIAIKLTGSKPPEKVIFNTAQIQLIMALANTPYPDAVDPSTNYNDYLAYIQARNNIFAAQITLVLIFTGMRINELLSMQLTDTTENYLIGGSKTDAGKNRVIPIHQYIKPLILSWQRSNTKYLVESFEHKKKNDKHFREREYYPMLESLLIEPKQTDIVKDGIKQKSKRIHTPHTCRHTFASLADNAAVNAKVLNMVVGHVDEKMRQRIYVHKHINEVITEINKIHL